MNKKNLLLEKIIGKMDGNQIRYFNKHHSTGKYLELFKDISNKKTDEAIISKYSQSNIGFLRNYLYHQLMDSLLQYHIQSNKQFYFENEFNKICLMEKMGLNKEYETELNRLLKICIKNQELELTQKLLEKLIKHHSKLQNQQDKKLLSKYISESTNLNIELNRKQEIKAVYFLMLLQLTKNRMYSISDDIDNIEGKYNNIQNIKTDSLDANTKVLFAGIHLLYNFFLNNTNAVLTHGLNYKKVYFKSNKITLDENYFQTIYFYIHALITEKKIKQCELELNEIRRLKLNTASLNAYRYFTYYSLLIRQLASTFQYKLLSAILGQLKRRYLDHITFITVDQISTLYLNAMLGNFIIGNFDNALYWHNQIFFENKNILRTDIKSFFRAIVLLIFIEQKNTSLIESQTNRCTREINKSQIKYTFEAAIIQFAKGVLEGAQETKLAQRLLDKLQLIEKSKKEQFAFIYFNFINYAKSKVKGISYKEFNLQLQNNT